MTNLTYEVMFCLVPLPEILHKMPHICKYLLNIPAIYLRYIIFVTILVVLNAILWAIRHLAWFLQKRTCYVFFAFVSVDIVSKIAFIISCTIVLWIIKRSLADCKNVQYILVVHHFPVAVNAAHRAREDNYRISIQRASPDTTDGLMAAAALKQFSSEN